MKIALLGTAPGSRLAAPFHDPDWTIWACSPPNRALPRIDAFFELHPVPDVESDPSYAEFAAWLPTFQGDLYLQQKHSRYSASIAFPMEAMVARWGSYFFTSTVAWMFAYAIEQQPETIGLWGIDMATPGEYLQQRAGCHYFINEALKLGIQITAGDGSDILQPPPLYGYCETQPMWRKLETRRKEMTERVAGINRQIEQMRDQSLALGGALEDIEYTMKVWGGAGRVPRFVEKPKPALREVVGGPPFIDEVTGE